MNTTNKQDEAAKYYAINQSNHFLAANDKTAFKRGAAWQKEQDKIIIDKLIEALKNNFDIAKGLSVIFYNELQEKKTPGNKEMYPFIKQKIDNTLQLLNSLK